MATPANNEGSLYRERAQMLLPLQMASQPLKKEEVKRMLLHNNRTPFLGLGSNPFRQENAKKYQEAIL